ncbi:LOB domain-containing protein 41 [Citrus sinensis]|nr:LOB domain-containing protein 41 [Citrus sinensis]
MRVSCNGCRVLRKGCGENCSIRPCLQWIKSPQCQANATLFLAKFYGRAGLACGRIVNPIYGSVGLMWSGRWHLCQAAVEAVFRGEPVTPLSSESALQAGDIRHVSKDESSAAAAAGSDKLHKVKSRRFKRSAPKPRSKPERAADAKVVEPLLDNSGGESTSCDPELTQRDSGEGDSVSVETVEATAMVESDDE